MNRLTRLALASLSLASLSLAFPALAQAADGYVTGNVNLRAGPDPSYPLVDQLPAGTEVDVQGCTDGWEWCDVINANDGSRGWIAGNFIQYEYQDQPVLLPEYGAQIGIPIVAFTIGAYWDNYYRGRPFYRERESWYHRDIPRRPPPPRNELYRGPVRGGPGNHYNPSYRGSQPGHPGPVRAEHAVQPTENGRPQSYGNRPPEANRTQPVQNSRPQQYGNRQPEANHAQPVQNARPQFSGNHPPAANHGQPARPANDKARPAERKDDHDTH
ncbi:SH3 domain-containing protein [Rhodanobacter koreensis]